MRLFFYIMVLTFAEFISPISDNFNFTEEVSQNEINLFFEDFIEIKQKHIDFEKIKFIIYGDSLSFKYWIHDSGVDKKSLETNFEGNINKTENLIARQQPQQFAKLKKFDFRNFDNYKKNYPSKRFVDYYVTHHKDSELFSIDFLVFNENKSKAIICYSAGIGGSYIEMYSKNKEKWFFYKTIAQTT